MGEDIQTQNQTQAGPEPQSIYQAESTNCAPTTTTTTTEEPSQTTTSKIPIRPKKVRKLSTSTDTSTPKTLVPKIIARTLSAEGEIQKALLYLKSSDPKLAPIIDTHQPPTFDSFHPPFLALTKSILYQQLAVKAGTAIYTRFVSLCGGESGVLPESVLALSVHQLRQIGVSARKASYLHDLANKYRNGILSDSAILGMNDNWLFTMLTMVKGIGSWSVHMFMIFSLHRPDVLPIGDLGVRKGVQLLYGLEQLPRPSQMEQLCEKWRPYRSVASWYMWRFAEGKGAPLALTNVSEISASREQQQDQQQSQSEQQPQILDQISNIAKLEACAWSQ